MAWREQKKLCASCKQEVEDHNMNFCHDCMKDMKQKKKKLFLNV